MVMKEDRDTRPGLGVPLAHILIYWIPLSLLLWGIILATLYFILLGVF